MRRIKRFSDKDKGLPPGTPVSTADHPIQSFLWADYTARAGPATCYRVVPLYGTPKNPKPDDAAAVVIDVTDGDGASGFAGTRVHTPRCLLQSRRHRLSGVRAGIRDATLTPRTPVQRDEVAVAGTVRRAVGYIGLAKDDASPFALHSTSSTTRRLRTRSPRRSRREPT